MGTIFVHSHPIRESTLELNLTLLDPVCMHELGWLTADKKRWPEQETPVLTMLALPLLPLLGVTLA